MAGCPICAPITGQGTQDRRSKRREWVRSTCGDGLKEDHEGRIESMENMCSGRSVLR